MKRDALHKYGCFLIYGTALLLCAFAMSGCALFQPCPVDAPAADLAHDTLDATADGDVDASEQAMLNRSADKVADALEEKSRRANLIPKTGVWWLDAVVELGKATLIGTATWKAVNVSRDRKRKKRGEPVEEVKAA